MCHVPKMDVQGHKRERHLGMELFPNFWHTACWNIMQLLKTLLLNHGTSMPGDGKVAAVINS